ncbi:MAG: ABC transporter permease, partial [Pseudomonadota bacterium]
GLNIVWTLFWLRFCPTRREEALKLVWAFTEPAGQILVLLVVFAIIGRSGGYGVSFALFLLTGVAGLSAFQRCMGAVSTAVVQLKSPQRPAPIGPFHDALGALGFTLLTAIVYTVGLAAAIGAWQRVAWLPVFPMTALAGLTAAAILGFGLGLIRGYCQRFAPIVTRTINMVSRVLIFISGVFYMPAYLPPFLRDWLAWNPILHAIELMRIGLYGGDYPALLLDQRFLWLFCLGLTAFALGLIWTHRAAVTE